MNSAFSIVEDILIDKGTAKAENILISLSEKIKNIDWKKFDKLAEKVAKVTKSAGKKINPILTGILLAYDYYPKFRDFYNDEILYQFQYTKPTISNISTVKCDTCQSDCNIYTIKINGEGFGTNQGVIKIDGDIVPANWSEKLIKVVNWQNKKDNCCICIDVIPCISCDTLKIQHYLLPCCQTGEDLLTINFDYDKFDVSEDDIKKIENFAKKNKGLRDISIFAHTDIYGNNSYNKNLATKRMETVKQLLNKYGIYLSQIKTSEVLGEEMPLLELPEVMPIDEKMHLPNRRVEIYAK